jgi:hypothetical protein
MVALHAVIALLLTHLLISNCIIIPMHAAFARLFLDACNVLPSKVLYVQLHTVHVPHDCEQAPSNHTDEATSTMHAHKCTHALALHKHPLGQATCRCWMALQFHVLDKHSSCHAAQHKQAAQLPNKQCPTPTHAGVLLLLLPRHPKCRWSHCHVAPVLVAHSCSRQCWADGGAAPGCRFQARGAS